MFLFSGVKYDDIDFGLFCHVLFVVERGCCDRTMHVVVGPKLMARGNN